MTPGLHLFHKPVGPTSFSIVQSCIESIKASQPHRRPRVCHGGTLDPFAQGLLLILTGSATRLFDHLHAIPKTYHATVRWGVETDTGDLLGQPSFSGDPLNLTPAQLKDALATFVGWQQQIPPATSAKRIDGERAYLKAHRGETVIMPPVSVYLHEARWLSHDLPKESRLELVTRGGYYVRAIARDLGRLLGCGAHLTQLHRTAIGPWTDPEPGQTPEVHGYDLLPWASSRDLTDDEVGQLRLGADVAIKQIKPGDWLLPDGFPPPQSPIRGYHREKLVFLLKAEGLRLTVHTELPGGL
jgi:tRNA pseudouridine55 synthase